MQQFGLDKWKTDEIISLTGNVLKVCAILYVKSLQAASVDIQVLQCSVLTGTQSLHRQSRAVHLCDGSLHHNKRGRALQLHCNRKSRVIHRIDIILTHLDWALGSQYLKGACAHIVHHNA